MITNLLKKISSTSKKLFNKRRKKQSYSKKKKTEIVSPGGGLEHHVDVLAELSIGNSASTTSGGRRRRWRRGILSAGREDRSRFFRHFLIFIFVVLIHVLDSFVISFVARLVVVITAEVAGKVFVAGFGLVVFVVKSDGETAAMDHEVQNLEDGPEET